MFAAPEQTVDVFVVDTTGGAAALAITEELRRAGVRADRAFGSRSMKSQMKAADRSGAAYAVIVGESETAAGTATVRPLRAGGEQVAVPRSELVSRMQRTRDVLLSARAPTRC